MWDRLKTGPKVALVLVAALLLVFGLQHAMALGWIPTPGLLKTVVPQKVVLPDVKDAQVADVTPAPLPTDVTASVNAPQIRIEMWEWNAQANLIYANGGVSTMEGSLMQKHNVNLQLIRQDDTNQMQQDLIACAKELHDNPDEKQCSNGANFVLIMGDGSGQFLAALNPLLKRLGPNYQAKIIGATGYSRGEDAFMAQPAVKRNPQAARGILVSGVIRDGDWNIAEKWAGDNNIPSNPDETTYDPNAINWVNAADYIKAADAYNANQCEDRKVVQNGKLTGEVKHVCVNAVVTWTPGDVNIAHGRGGLVKIVSSRQYRSQMPDVLVGPINFAQQNRDEIEGMLAAMLEAGDQLKAYDQSLRKAAAISAKVYNDQDGDYWYKYFKGVTETDPQGLKVELGGSSVNNLADEEILFGLQPGTNDNFRATYTLFAGIDMQQYPQMYKNTPIPQASEIEDKSFITGAAAVMASPGSAAEQVNYASESTGQTVSTRSYQINFDTGKASFTSQGIETMQQLKDSLSITGLFIKVDGYTDNTGSESVNLALSQARAQAVKDWLQKTSPLNFPNSRFQVNGHGADNPVASNLTDAGKAQNRRVEITLLGS